MSENQLDRKDLKIQALLEKLSTQESQIADLRVELTISRQQANELQAKLTEIEQEIEGHRSSQVPKIVEGQVVPTPDEEE